MTKRILIIEDERSQVDALCRFLVRRGYKPECVGTLGEGVQRNRDLEFDCVILDLGLPDTASPLETAQRIAEFDGAPLVALTGSEDPDIVHEVRQAGASYLLKPTDPEMLMERIAFETEFRRPSRDTELLIIQAQKEQSRAFANQRKPWFLQWAPAISVTLALLGASGTGGMFLYRSISDDARQQERNAAHFEKLDQAQIEASSSIRRLTEVQNELQIKAQTSIEDRSGLHRELGALAQSQRELRDEVIRRLDKLQDGQNEILKDRANRIR